VTLYAVGLGISISVRIQRSQSGSDFKPPNIHFIGILSFFSWSSNGCFTKVFPHQNFVCFLFFPILPRVKPDVVKLISNICCSDVYYINWLMTGTSCRLFIVRIPASVAYFYHQLPKEGRLAFVWFLQVQRCLRALWPNRYFLLTIILVVRNIY